MSLMSCVFETEGRNHDQFATDLAFGAVRRGRWAAADFDIHELAGPPVGALVLRGAAAGLVALIEESETCRRHCTRLVFSFSQLKGAW
jgi:hypothetical protein